ncbi:MAG: hypothetical protein AB1656_25070 [Candidatus Omnitrophota bacterium]
MPSRDSRSQLEAKLKAMLDKAEKIALNDPKLKNMVEQLRNIYLTDRQGFMFAMGLSGPEPAQTKPRVRPLPPPSRIPQLIMMMDALASGRMHLEPSSAINPPSLLSPFPPPVKKPAKAGPLPQTAPPPLSIEEIRRQLLEVEKELSQTTDVFWALKKEEKNIRARKGKYIAAVERLKAERLLRELPGAITQLSERKITLLETCKEMENAGGDSKSKPGGSKNR